MRKITLVSLLGLALLGAAPASAENDVTTITGTATWADAQNGYLWSSQCRLVAAAQDPGAAGGNATYTGVVTGTAVVYKPATNELASVDLRCQVRVGGVVVVPGGNGPSNGIDNDSNPQVVFTATDTQPVEVCISMPGISTATVCTAVARATTPPGEAQNLVGDSQRIVNDAICPALKSLAPIVVSTVFELEPDGDVKVLGNRLYDCPPYGS